MLSTNDLINVLLPVISHWLIWLIFLIVVIVILLLYAYPYTKKPKKEFHIYHVGIPITNIISLYIFTKMLEGVIYQGVILKIDAWFNVISYPIWIIKIASFITNFGGSVVITIFLMVILGALVLRKRWRYALLSIVAILGATILQATIKVLVSRIRPENLIETGFSFPSGHAITAIVFVSLLIYSFKDDIKNPIIKYVLIILSASFFVVVGISRIILHVNWFSDVVAGISLGLFWFMLLVLIEKSITGLIPAVRKETKKAEPIVPAVLKE